MLNRLLYARTAGHLARGEGVLARWTIAPAQWREFTAASHRSSATKDKWRNELDPGREPPVAGVEVVLSDAGVLVGGDFFPTPWDAVATLDGALIEFDRFVAGGARGGGHHVVVRVPVAAGSERIAAAVVARRRARFPAALRRARRNRLVALGLFLLAAVPTIIVFWSELKML